VMLLAEGDLVSADARLSREIELRVEKSVLTDESSPVMKSADTATGMVQNNLIFAGTDVREGSGEAVAFATGMKMENLSATGLIYEKSCE